MPNGIFEFHLWTTPSKGPQGLSPFWTSRKIRIYTFFGTSWKLNSMCWCIFTWRRPAAQLQQPEEFLFQVALNRCSLCPFVQKNFLTDHRGSLNSTCGKWKKQVHYVAPPLSLLNFVFCTVFWFQLKILDQMANLVDQALQ